MVGPKDTANLSSILFPDLKLQVKSEKLGAILDHIRPLVSGPDDMSNCMLYLTAYIQFHLIFQLEIVSAQRKKAEPDDPTFT